MDKRSNIEAHKKQEILNKIQNAIILSSKLIVLHFISSQWNVLSLLLSLSLLILLLRYYYTIL